MHSEQSGDTNSKVNPSSLQAITKKKRQPKKPKSTTTISNKENLSAVVEETSVNTENSVAAKKNKKRNNKKKKNSTIAGEKTENLISLTFKASKTQSGEGEELTDNLVNDLKTECVKNASSIRLNNSGNKNNSKVSNSPSNINVSIKKTEDIATKNEQNKKLEQPKSTKKKNLVKKQCKEGSQSQSNSESSPKLPNKLKNQEEALAKSLPSESQKINKRKEKIAKSPKTALLESPKSKNIHTETNPKSLKSIQDLELTNKNNIQTTSSMDCEQNNKSRQEILATRECKRLTKSTKKGNTSTAKTVVPTIVEADMNVNKEKTDVVKNTSNLKNPQCSQKPISLKNDEQKPIKSREDILAEREAKKLAKQAAKSKNKATVGDGEENNVIDNTKIPKDTAQIQKKSTVENLANKIETLQITSTEGQKKKPTTKAERRAIQEAQREAKAKGLVEKPQSKNEVGSVGKQDTQKKREIQTNAISSNVRKIEKLATLNTSPSKPRAFKVKFFNQLETKIEEQNLFVNNPLIHPVMVRLGEQYAKRIVVGSNARCIAFLDALKTVIQDYETPPKKEFSRGLEASIKNCVDHLQKCRPLAVSVSNAYKYIKVVLTKLPENQPESELKKYLVELIDIYIKDQIEKAAQAISYNVLESITEGDVILTYGCSSLITHILEEANRKQIDFRVIVVDSHPFCEGQELLRRLVSKGISCTCVLINAVGFIMPEVKKVLLGAHALLANGYVVSRIGTAQVALVARSFNVPVFVCCEKHKFSERTQTDAIVYNELGNPNDLISKTKDCKLKDWKAFPSLYPLNLNYDVTPPELVNVVVTEVTLMPSTSAPVILRIRPNEMIS